MLDIQLIPAALDLHTNISKENQNHISFYADDLLHYTTDLRVFAYNQGLLISDNQSPLVRINTETAASRTMSCSEVYVKLFRLDKSGQQV